MSISSVTTSPFSYDLLRLSASSSSSFTSSASGASNSQSFESTLSSLISSIESGDLTATERYLTAAEQNSPQQTNGRDPIGRFLSGVEGAVSDGSISEAQTALATFESYTAPVQGASSETPNSREVTMSNLADAIRSGDLTSAKQYVDMLQKNNPNGANGTDPISEYIAAVQSAIANGSVTTAQSALLTFQAYSSPSVNSVLL